jgi:hypothetical protein
MDDFPTADEIMDMTDDERVAQAETLWDGATDEQKDDMVFVTVLAVMAGEAHLGVTRRVLELAARDGIDAPPAELVDL